MQIRSSKSKSPARKPIKGSGGGKKILKSPAMKKQHELHTLLKQTKDDLEHLKKGIPLEVPDMNIVKDESFEVAGDEHFLLLFFEHVSFIPRAFVDLTRWGVELIPKNMKLTEKLDRTVCTCILLKDIDLTTSIITWLSSFPNLRYLGLESCRGVGKLLTTLVRKCQALKGLGLAKCNLTDRNIMLLTDAAERRLDNIDLSWNVQLTDEGIDYLGDRCNSLQKVKLCGLPRLHDAALVGSVGSGGLLPTHGPTLKHFDISHCSGITDESIQSLLTHVHDNKAPKLEYFNLSFLLHLTDDALRCLVDRHDVSSWFVGDLELGRKRANPLKTVKEVNISGSPKVSGAAIAYLSYGCTMLTKITMSDGQLFDDKAFGALRSLRHLNDITAERLPKLTHRGVIMLIEGGDGYEQQHKNMESPCLIEELLHLRLNQCENLEGATVIASVSRAKATRSIMTLELGNTCPTRSSSNNDLSQLNELLIDDVAVDAEVLKKLCYNCTDLTQLDLCGVPAILNKQSLYTLSARLRKNLKSLNIGKCQLTAADAFNPLRAMKPKLTTLKLPDSPFLLDGIAAHFPVSVTCLDVSGCSKLTNHFLETLHRSCPNLVNLDVSNDPLLSDVGLLHFLDSDDLASVDEYAEKATIPRVSTLEHFSCMGTNISDTALDALASKTAATSLLTANQFNELPEEFQENDLDQTTLPCMVMGRQQQDADLDTHEVKMSFILYDFEMEDLDSNRTQYFKNQLRKVIGLESNSYVVSIRSCSGEIGSVVIESYVSGLRSRIEAEDIVTRILNKQRELIDVYQFGRFKLQSVETIELNDDNRPTDKSSFPTEPEEKSTGGQSLSSEEEQSLTSHQAKPKTSVFRGIQPIGGSQSAMERRMFMTKCSQRDSYAPKLQKWARQRLNVKHNCARFKLETDSCKRIQQLFRMWHTQQYFYRAIAFRLNACIFIQRAWRKYLNLQKIHQIIAKYRAQIQGRAFEALRESMANTHGKGDAVSKMAFRKRQRVWLHRWHHQLNAKRRIFDEMADEHYANSILRKTARAWHMSVANAADRRKALAVVFLTSSADLLVHYNSSRQLAIAPLGEYHWRHVFGPKHLRAWSKVAKAAVFLRTKIDRLVARLVKRWRPWARERKQWKQNALKMVDVRKRQTVRHLHLWAIDCEVMRMNRHHARLHYIRALKFRSYQAIAAVAEAARQAIADRVALAEERLVWPRKLRYMQICYQEWIIVTAYKKQGRLAATAIQDCFRDWIARKRQDEARMKESRDARKAELFWKRRRYPLMMKLHKWASWRGKYHPPADLQAYLSPLRWAIKGWRLGIKLEFGALTSQRIVRGFLARRWTQKFIMNREWAAMTISKSLRAAIFRRNLTNVHRLRLRIIALQDVSRAMVELDEMAKEDLMAHLMDRNHKAAIRIQVIFRGLMGKRRWQNELAEKILRKAREEKEAQLAWKAKAREAARQREIELQHTILMAIRVQNAWRTRNARKLLSLILTFNARTKVATLLQSSYRGRIGRRIGYGRRRNANLRMKVLKSRVLESSILRSVGITRRTFAGPMRLGQTTARKWMRAADMSPLMYNNMTQMRSELREDFLDARHAVLCRIEMLKSDGLRRAYFTRIPKRVENRFNVVASSACQVIQEGHPLNGYTGYVLAVDYSDRNCSMAEVRMDRDGTVHFLPVATEEKKGKPSEQVLIRVKKMEFVHVAKVASVGIRNRWRNELIQYAASNMHFIRKGRKAIIIQSAFRQYKARAFALQLREEAGIRNAVRCEKAVRTLKRYGMYHREGAHYLSLWYWAWYGLYHPHLAGVRIPADLPAKPTRALQRADENRRNRWREMEVKELTQFLERRNEYYGGDATNAARLVASGIHPEDLPVNFKEKMPWRRIGRIKKMLWRRKYQKRNELMSHHSGLSGGVGLVPGFKGDGFSEQPLGLRVHDENIQSILGRKRNKKLNKANKRRKDDIGLGVLALKNRSELVTSFHPSTEDGGGAKQLELVTAPNGTIYHRAANVVGRDKIEMKKINKEESRELSSTGVTHMELAQLKTMPYTTSDGWAVVHSVYNKGQPDGWSVIHLLTGKKPESKKSKTSAFRLGTQVWTKDHSLEMKLRKETKKANIARRAAAVRRSLQVEIRQLRLEDVRLREGPVKYASRTAPTKAVEDELMDACTSLQRLEKQTARDLAPVVAEEEASMGPYCEAMEKVAAADHRVRAILRHVSPEDHPPWPTEGKCPDSDEDESLTKEPIVLLRSKINSADVDAVTAEIDAKTGLEIQTEELEEYNEALDVEEANDRALKWAYHYGAYLLECVDNFGLACGNSPTVNTSATRVEDDSSDSDSSDGETDADEEAIASANGMSFTSFTRSTTSFQANNEGESLGSVVKQERPKPQYRCSAYPLLTRGITRFGRSRKYLTTLTNKDGGKWAKPKSIHWRLSSPPPSDYMDEDDDIEFDDDDYDGNERTIWKKQKQEEKARAAMERDSDIHPYHFKICGTGRGCFKLVTRPGATTFLEGKLVSLPTSAQGRSFPLWDGARIVIGRHGHRARTFIFRDDPKNYPPSSQEKFPEPLPMNPRFIRSAKVNTSDSEPPSPSKDAGTQVQDSKAEGKEGDEGGAVATSAPISAPMESPRRNPLNPNTPPAWVRCERKLNPSPAPPPVVEEEIVVEELDENGLPPLPKVAEEKEAEPEKVNPNVVQNDFKDDDEAEEDDQGNYGDDEVEYVEGMAEVGRNRKAAMSNLSEVECVHGDMYHGVPAVMATTHMRKQISDLRGEDTPLKWGETCKNENRKRLEMSVASLVGSRQSTKALLETLGQLVRSCEAKVEAITGQISDNDKIRKDKSNPKYMRERAKDERKKLMKEALPEAEAAYEEAKIIYDKKKAESEALISHLEELVAAAEVGDAEAVACAEREIEWQTAVSVRLSVERRNEAQLQRQRQVTQRLVKELQEKVTNVRMFDDATASRKHRINSLHARLVSMQKAEHTRRETHRLREEKIKAKIQEEADIRNRNLKIERLQRLVRAGWIPSTRIQEAMDKLTKDVATSELLEKEAKRMDRKKELEDMLGKLGAAASHGIIDGEGGPFRDIASLEEEIGRPDQRTKADYIAWTEPLEEAPPEDMEKAEREAAEPEQEGEVNDPGEAEADAAEKLEEKLFNDPPELRVISTIRCNMRGGHIHGLVQVKFVDGSEFFGPWDDSLRKPLESVILPEDDKFPESWDREHSHLAPMSKFVKRLAVEGKWTTPEGVVWESDVINIDFEPLKACGLFTIKTPLGELYDGHILRGKPNGFGRKKFKDSQPLGGFFEGEYIGEWRDGLRHGKGTCILKNEEMYQGDWMSDWMDGVGKQTFPDGSTYEGDFQRSRWHGKGERRMTNGDIYIGGFKGGEMTGYGELKYADGSQYLGDWLNSKRHGQGLFITSQNERYDGSWDNDDLHGQVTWHGRQSVAKGMPTEPVTRDGEYDHGVRLHWLSTAITATSTKAFVQFFCEIERVDAQRREKYTLQENSFALEYATLAAVMMPQPPPAVDPDNAAVKLIMHQICATHTLQPLIGQTVEDRLVSFNIEAKQQLDSIDDEIGIAEAKRQEIVNQWRFQKGEVNRCRKELKECRKRIKFNLDAINKWWGSEEVHVATNRPPGGPPVDTRFEESTILNPKLAREEYISAVEMLRSIPPIEWKRMRSKALGKQLPQIAVLLLETLCILFDHPPDHASTMLLLSDAEYNLIHVPQDMNHGFMAGQLPIGAPSTAAAKYECKVVNLLPWWQVYDWSNLTDDKEKAQRFKTVARNVVHNPRMDPHNTKLIEAGVPLSFIVVFIEAAYHYATACAHVYQFRQDLYIARSEARYKMEQASQAERAEEALQSEMRDSYEALRKARAPWVDAWARVQALEELSLEVYHFRLLSTEYKKPDPVILGPPVAVASLGYQPNAAKLVDSRPDMQHESTRQFVGKAQKRLLRLQELAQDAASSTPLELIELIKTSEGEAELLNAVMALDDMLTGRNDKMAAVMEEMSEREVADLRSTFVSNMVKLQVEDKDDDGDPLDHKWSALVEKCYYETQQDFEQFAASRPRRLFLDYIHALEVANTPKELALSMEEATWWCKQNLPQNQTLWHKDFAVYVDEISNTLTSCLNKNPRLLAPDITGKSVTLEPHKELLDDLNRYKGFNVTNLWWDKLGDWEPIYNDEDGTIMHYQRLVPSDEGGEYGGGLEYSYDYPVPPEPGREDEFDEFGYEFEGEEGEEAYADTGYDLG